ncbi:MAG TPA: YpdA family putative bacillithiol disulfide reductase [Vicinamibacterales bacterium]|nr:YpdA family putative bacillithiol disulfide reductase [Vicinamibacterales bacterium]
MTAAVDLLVVGAGPAGLAAAIAARRLGLSALVIEKGALVNSILHYPTDMVFFTTPELLEIGGYPFVSPHEKPTRTEALRYYRRVTDAAELHVSLREAVTAITPRPEGGFVVESERGGARQVRAAAVVVVATGAFDRPNRLDIPGEDLPHVSHYYREAHTGYRQRVVVVGGKNSAADAALELYRAGATVTLVHRGEALGESIKYWVKPDLENRIAEGAIAARFRTRVVEITPDHVQLVGPDGERSEPADAVLLLTGYHSDPTLLESAGAALDETTGAPVHDPETFETTVPGLYVVGSCVAGTESGRIFIENGRFHGAAAVTAAARRLRRNGLALPRP